MGLWLGVGMKPTCFFLLSAKSLVLSFTKHSTSQSLEAVKTEGPSGMCVYGGGRVKGPQGL